MKGKAIAIYVVLFAAGCGGTLEPTPIDSLKGGIVATFAVSSDTFRVWIRKPEAIEQVFALQRGVSEATIPNGRLQAGAGQGAHNAPYSWHLDPDDISMAAVTIELCDGAPSYIEAHRDEFISQVGRYCPWGARLVAIVDYR